MHLFEMQILFNDSHEYVKDFSISIFYQYANDCCVKTDVYVTIV